MTCFEILYLEDFLKCYILNNKNKTLINKEMLQRDLNKLRIYICIYIINPESF